MAAKSLSKIHKRVLDKNRKELELNRPTNNFWDDARNHYVQCVEAIAKVEGTLRDNLVDFVKDETKVKKLDDPIALANNITILTKDIAEHSDRLTSIYAKHSDKLGGTVTPDEHIELLHIHGEYADALEIYEANIIPTMAHILEQIGIINELVDNEMNLMNPNVVTDVEIKTTNISENSYQPNVVTLPEINQNTEASE